MGLRTAVRARLRGEEDRSRIDAAAFAAMPLEEFVQSDLQARIESRVLGETVIFAGAEAQVPPQTDTVVYRGAELLLVRGLTPEHLRRVHQVKKVFDGRILERGSHG